MSKADPDTAPELTNSGANSPIPLIDRDWPLWRMVMYLAVPWWTQQFLHLAVSLSDSYLAGRHLDLAGDQSVAGQAAQTNANYLLWFISSFAVLVSAGATALVARFWGARDRANAIHATNQAMVLALLFGLAAGALGVIFTSELVLLLQLEGQAAEMTVAYLRPIFVALPLQLIAIVGIACLVGAGDTVTGMVVWSMVALINVPLAWGFGNGWGPLPELGFPGIAIGTAVSQGLGCVAVLITLAVGRAGLRLDLEQLYPDRHLIWRLLRVSVPAGIDSLSLAFGQLVFLGMINQLNVAAVAGHGIAIRWEGLGYLTANAFGVAAMSLVGQNLGAGRPEMAARSGWTALGLGCLIMCGMGLIFFVLAEPMFWLFCPKPEQRAIIDQGVPALQLIAFAMPSAAACIILPGALRGAGDTRIPILFTWVGFFGVRLTLALLLTRVLDIGLIGAWWAMCADLTVRGAAFLVRFAGGRWKEIKV